MATSYTLPPENTDVVSATDKKRFTVWLYILLFLMVLVLTFSLVLWKQWPYLRSKLPSTSTENTAQSSDAESDEYIVDKVIDGDTIDVSREGLVLRVRYIGVNTPETVKPNSPVECFGKEASAFNKSLVEKKVVVLEKDVQDTDSFGRALRYVYLKEQDGSVTMVNKKLVEEGYAYSASYPPNVHYQSSFQDAERTAREANKGLWAKCPVR